METSDTLVLVSAPSVCPCRLSRLLRQGLLVFTLFLDVLVHLVLSQPFGVDVWHYIVIFSKDVKLYTHFIDKLYYNLKTSFINHLRYNAYYTNIALISLRY